MYLLKNIDSIRYSKCATIDCIFDIRISMITWISSLVKFAQRKLLVFHENLIDYLIVVSKRCKVILKGLLEVKSYDFRPFRWCKIFKDIIILLFVELFISKYNKSSSNVSIYTLYLYQFLINNLYHLAVIIGLYFFSILCKLDKVNWFYSKLNPLVIEFSVFV